VDLDAVDAGKHDVEDDEVGGGLDGHGENGEAVAHGDDLVAFTLEVKAYEFDNILLIIDYQDSAHVWVTIL
jgi:hypothetical protein